MPRPLLPFLLAGVLLAPAAPQRPPRELGLVECFALDSALVPPHAEPFGFLDPDHLLVYDDIGEDGERKTWYLLPATGDAERRPYLEAGWFDALLEQPGMRADLALEALDDADAFYWTEDFTGFVADIGNDLFHYDVPGQRWVRLTNTPGEEVGVQPSPDGRSVAFIHDHDLHVVPSDGSAPPRPLTDGGHEDLLYGRLDWVYQEELYGRGNFQGFWWSPDSTRIALLRLDESPVQEFTLVSDTPVRPEVETVNYPKAGEPNPVADLGVVDVAGGAVRWFDLARYGTQDLLIVRVDWRPDGSEVFFQVQEREQRWLEMLAGSAADGGTPRLVFREESPCYVEPGFDARWLRDGGEFLWLSQRSGFRHVYRYRSSGELIGALTGGEFGVDQVVHVDETGGRAFVLSDRGDFKQQNLWTVPLAGGEMQRITPEDGWHEVRFASDGSRFLDDYSRIDHKLTRTVRAADDGAILRRLRDSRDRILQVFGVQRPRFVQVPNRDGFLMEAMLIEPRNFDPERKYPVLCSTYAGPHTPRVLDKWRWRDFLWHQRMAQQGYLVWVVDNRSASGKGRQASCASWRRFGVTELRDLEDALDWLLEQGYADPERCAIWGWSYGGYQTLYNLTHSRKWVAGVAVNPVTDWRLYDTIYTERYMGLPQTNAEGYEQASVLESAGDLYGEVLLAHSTMDDNVHLQNSLSLIWELQQAGKSFRFMPYPRVRHGIEDFRQQLHLFATIEGFLDEHIGGRPR